MIKWVADHAVRKRKSDFMLSLREETVLKIISEKKLIKKSELVGMITRRDLMIPMSVIKSLQDQKLIAKITPLGEESYSITKTGAQALKELV